MKMIYLEHSRRPRRGRMRTVAVISLLVIIFAVDFFFPHFYPALFYPITSFFWKGEINSVGFVASFVDMMRSKNSLVLENDRLAKEIEDMKASMLVLESLRNENETLKATLGRTDKGLYVMGVILARPPVSPYDTLIIDIGSDHGLLVGDKVYAKGGVPIGDIAEVYERRSKVDLFSTGGRITSVLLGTSTIAAEATGQGGGNFEVVLPKNASLIKGASVSLPDIRPNVFGIVESISIDATDSLQTVLFKSPINVSELRFVEIDIQK